MEKQQFMMMINTLKNINQTKLARVKCENGFNEKKIIKTRKLWRTKLMKKKPIFVPLYIMNMIYKKMFYGNEMEKNYDE